ncbi:mCG5478, partial [Mus musculus]
DRRKSPEENLHSPSKKQGSARCYRKAAEDLRTVNTLTRRSSFTPPWYKESWHDHPLHIRQCADTKQKIPSKEQTPCSHMSLEKIASSFFRKEKKK